MKSILISAVIASILAVGVFSFIFMDHDAGHNPMGCIAVTTSRGVCPQTGGSLEFLLFHISALKHVSTAVLLLAFVSILVIITGVIRIIKHLFPQYFLSTFYDQQKEYIETIVPRLKKQFTDWLSLHEKRDPHASSWCMTAATLRVPLTLACS